MATSEVPNQGFSTVKQPVKVVIATSVMLSFISFWRAAAIVLNDLGSSAFYAGGIAEHAIGHSAPWFILAVMLFSYAVRSVYVESCGMFTRGGVYRVVKAAMGGTLAKLSGSALIFDYILTGPISGVSAGQYILGLIAQTSTYFGFGWHPDKGTVDYMAAGIAFFITLYFWWRNTLGVHESSDDALKIMKVTTVMVILLIVWSTITIFAKPEARRLPPLPSTQSLTFNPDAVGWMPQFIPDNFVKAPKPVETKEAAEHKTAEEPNFIYGVAKDVGLFFTLVCLFIGFGHSILAMSGEESLAQVNRELEYPKHKNLMRAGAVIFVYSLLFTSLVSFFAYAIIPDAVHSQYYDNLISGIAMYLVGPTPLKLLFQGFIVIVGFLMLAGAVNTAIIGSNGVLNRLSEDGVLADWFRAPHRRYGTSYRIINLIVALQLVTIVASRGDVYMLGEAYAFGVVWSFAFKSLSVFILRFKTKTPREWRVPLNVKVKDTEFPLGLFLITIILFIVAGINLITKQVATISGLAFTFAFFALLNFSEKITERRRGGASHVQMDQFQTYGDAMISPEGLQVKPGNILCLVRDYNTLEHVKRTLEITNTGEKDLVVATIRLLKGPDSGYEDLSEKDLFTSYEQLLFSRVVSLAEKAGKKVHLLVVPASEVFQAIALTAVQLGTSEIVAGRSSIMRPEVQSTLLGQAWEKIASSDVGTVRFKVIEPKGGLTEFYLGAHLPQLTQEDIHLIHDIWLDLVQKEGHKEIHHRDVVSIALKNLSSGMTGPFRDKVLHRIFESPPHH
jgi:amino acid transporter